MGRKYTDNIYEEANDVLILKIKYKNEYISCYCDLEDKEIIQQYHWRISHKRNKVYVVTGKSGNPEQPLMYLHNLLMNYKTIPQMEVDHIDGNSCNNRKTNLRIVSRQQNIDNTRVRCDNTVGIRGISQDKRNKRYQCDFSYHGQRWYFKTWSTIAEAVWCRKMAEDYFHLDTLTKNPLANQYCEQLTNEQKRQIQIYVYDKISQKETV